MQQSNRSGMVMRPIWRRNLRGADSSLCPLRCHPTGQRTSGWRWRTMSVKHIWGTYTTRGDEAVAAGQMCAQSDKTRGASDGLTLTDRL